MCYVRLAVLDTLLSVCLSVCGDAVKLNIGIRCALWTRHMLLGTKTSTTVT